MNDDLGDAKRRGRDSDDGFMGAGTLLASCFVMGLFGIGHGFLRVESVMLSLGSIMVMAASAWIWWKRTGDRLRDDRAYRERYAAAGHAQTNEKP